MDYQLEQEIKHEHDYQPEYRYQHEHEQQHEYMQEDEHKYDPDNELDHEAVLGTNPQHEHRQEHQRESEREHEPSQALIPQPQIEGLHKNRFEYVRLLGRGFMGMVYLCRDRRSSYLCAVKMMLRSSIRARRLEHQIGREIDIHNNLRHPNILRLLGHFHDDTFVNLILEYAGQGELFKALKKAKDQRFDQERAAMYVLQVASALKYLHRKKVMHRDIKLENILIGNYGEIKLADFGWSVHEPENWRDTMCGTWDYLPPEMLLRDENVNEGGYDEKVDIYALGILTYEFLVGNPP